MAIDPQNTIIGPVRVEFGGVDLGLTTDDGVSVSSEMTVADLTAPQSVGMLRSFRTTASFDITCSFRELTQSNIRLLMDLADAPASSVLAIKPQHNVTTRPIVVTMPGPGGCTRVVTGTAGVVSTGEATMNTADYSSMEVTFRFFISPATGSYGTITDGATSLTLPTVSTWEYFTTSVGSPTTLTDGATGVPIAAKFLLTFAAQIRPDQLDASSFILKTAAGDSQIACAVAYNGSNFDEIVLTPAANLTNEVAHEILIPAGLVSIAGAATTALQARQFTTVAA